jgi:hypothetical protein
MVVGFSTDSTNIAVTVVLAACPLCQEPLISVGFRRSGAARSGRPAVESMVLWPRKARSDVNVSAHVPDEYAREYVEATLVLPISPKASAALSRRLLQRILREVANVKHGDLVDEITEVRPKLPAEFAEDVDLVRNFGNIAAHPMKNKTTGEILDVEEHEAETCLLMIGHLFDFYFERPAAARARRDLHVAKLAAAGKKVNPKP